METYASIAAWSQDFIRAARERPLWARLLFRFAMGKYAYREFIGLMDELERKGNSPYLWYGGLDEQEMHKDPVPFDWSKERKPVSRKEQML